MSVRPLTCARCLVLGILAGCAAEPSPADTSEESLGGAFAAGPIALTDEGLVRGIATDGTRRFLGIPYAAPPVGDARWRPPARHARWHGVRDATQFGPHCPQGPSPFGLASTTEDCLFLNVFVPAHRPGDRVELHPVMVWIHGGALVVGESDDYDPAQLVEQGDVIVVTINYRLGALGFLAHPALTAESSDHVSGNYGILDQQAALAWVRRNIVFFGGNPFNVTIFGESAGGLSVHTQLASPLAHGLFARAVAESGAYQLTQPSLATAENAGTAFAAQAGCADQTAACLRGLSVTDVLSHQSNAAGGTSPVVDGKVLPQSVGAAFSSGAMNRVPVIEGSNHDEWRLFVALDFDLVGGPVTAAGYPAAIQATLGVPAAVVPLFVAAYPLAAYPSPDLALSALGTDGIFACNALKASGLLVQHVPTFAYEFNDENAPEIFLPPVSFPYGAAHASELQYLFGLRHTVPAPPLDDAQEQLSDAMVGFWTHFARTGQPGDGWPRFDGTQLESLAPPSPTTETAAGFAADHKCAFWASLTP